MQTSFNAAAATATAKCKVTRPDPAFEAGAAAGRPIQVLLVEDDSESAELTQIRLTQTTDEHYLVEWSPNLLRAINRLSEPGIDVVLLDLGLPELTGYKTCRAIEWAAGDRIPIVVLTGDDRRTTRDLSLAYGAKDFLLKNKVTPVEIRKAIRKAALRLNA